MQLEICSSLVNSRSGVTSLSCSGVTVGLWIFMLTHDKTQLVWVSDSLRLLWQLGLFTSVVCKPIITLATSRNSVSRFLHRGSIKKCKFYFYHNLGEQLSFIVGLMNKLQRKLILNLPPPLKYAAAMKANVQLYNFYIKHILYSMWCKVVWLQ